MLRNAVVLSLTATGVIFVTVAVAEDGMAAKMVLGMGCFLLAAVYWQITKGRRG